MRVHADTVGTVLLGVGSLLLLVTAALLATGNWNVVGYAVPTGLVGLGAVGVGVWRLGGGSENAPLAG